MILHKALRKQHEQVDKGLARLLATHRDTSGSRVSCRKGCAACCSLDVTVSLAEVIVILTRLHAENPGLTHYGLAPLFLESAKILADPEMDNVKYAALRRPCGLLSSDKSCSVYSDRPVICRAHVSFDPPENCSVPGFDIRTLPGSKILAGVFPAYCEIMHNANMPNPIGPLPYMMLVGMYLLEKMNKKPKGDAEAIRKLLHTSAMHEAKSAVAWMHLQQNEAVYPESIALARQSYDPLPTVYPIWDLIPADEAGAAA